MKQLILKTVSLALAALIPFALVAVMVFALPGVYSNTFLGELSDKYERLYSVKENKIVVIGGSSVAFGLDSPMLEELTGMPVVNFGLYATLGTKLMLDLSRGAVREGDIIVLAPELDEQTLSLYFNSEATWQACDSKLSMLLRVGKDDRGAMAGGAVDYLGNKLKYLREGRLDPAGVYNHASFDAYGDIVYDRPYNVMTYGYDMNKPVSFGSEQYSEEFIEYLQDYIAFCKKRGAQVCYSFPPVNRSGIAPGTTEESYAELYAFLCRTFDCEIISDPADYVMDSKYFYDTNFHPNAAGARRHTAVLAEDLRRLMGNSEIMLLELPEPEEKPQGPGTEGGDDLWSALFTYEERRDNEGNLLGYAVSGTAAEAASMLELEIPGAYQGKPVMEICAGAFSGSGSLRSLTIRENVVSIRSGAFRDCPSLAEIHIYNENESTMSVDQSTLFDGAASGITIWLHSEASYESYVTGYFWANYGSMMKLAK